jgi:large subunit ribosomal protein L23
MALFGIGKTEEKKKTPATNKPGQLKIAKDSEASTPETTKSKTTQKTSGNTTAYKQLIHPLITEKTSALGAYNQYAFSVAKSANKSSIKKAITEVYGVNPIKVMIINSRGKKVRTGKNTTGYLNNWKKAIVVIPAGQKIDVYES